MKSIGTSDIRNIALVGHGHCGKTSLTEAMLFASGQLSRLGSTDQGTATTDYSEDEHEHSISIRLALAHVLVDGKKINIVDTPGYGNFLYDAKVGLSVADTALVVLDALSGIEVQTARVWKFADEVGTPARVIVLNKMDRENVDVEKSLAQVTERFGREAVAIQVPIGVGPDFKGVVDILTGKSYTSQADGSVAVSKGDVPADLADTVSSQREALMEMVAESDETLMEKFLEEGELSEEDLRQGLQAAVSAGSLYPVAFASATTMVGIQALTDLVTALSPTPAVRGERAGKEDKKRPVNDDAPVSLQVFKTLQDPRAGRLSLFRLESGTLSGDTSLRNVGRKADERCSTPLAMQGKDHEKMPDMHAGDLACLIKLKETLTGDTLAAKNDEIEYEPLPVPEPPMSFAIEAKTQG